MAQILNNPADFGLLQLSLRLRQELKASLAVLLSGLMQGSAAWRLRGVMFSPELAVAGTVPNTRLDTPTWKAVIDDCDAVSGRKLGFDRLKMLRLILLSLIGSVGAGTLLSLIVNRTQIYQAQETASQAADTTKPWQNACTTSSYSSKPLPVCNTVRRPAPHGTPDLVLIRTATRWPHSGRCMRKITHS